jgi:transcriptional regulator with XRE-family HTH domain
VNGLAQRLKEARKQSGLSQEKLAEAVGVSGHAVYLFERGKNRPALDALERIAAATGKPLPWFFGADAAPEPAAPPGAQAAAPSPAPQAHAPPDTQALLAQLVQAQVQADQRADQRHREMMGVLTALAHEQMQTRAEAARTGSRRMRSRSRLMDWGTPRRRQGRPGHPG